MFRTREEILEVLEKTDFEKDPISKDVLSLLSEPVTLQRSAELISYANNDLTKAVANLKVSDETMELVESTTKECGERLIAEELLATGIKYRCMLADVLSVFREDSKCMAFVVHCYLWVLNEIKKDKYLVNNLPLNFEIIAYENLGLIYSDENCAVYNLHEAFVNFGMLDFMSEVKGYREHLKNADYIYGHAKALMAHDGHFPRGFAMIKDAAAKGHPKAKIEFQNICRQKNYCTNCGGTFKGIFTKKCSSCGKKKDY